MSNTSENNEPTCANCGKGEEAGSDLKSCAACKLVKYCSRDCQIAHRPQHKKECKKRAMELYDEKLFKQPPPNEDCPICMIRLPTLVPGRTYMNCCGKMICCGCVYEFRSRAFEARRQEEDDLCPFCRTPPPTSDDDMIKRYKKRSDLNDPIGMRNLGYFYARGLYGLPQSYAKALELWHRAAEFDADAYYSIGMAYESGYGVEQDMKKARHYWELAAINGHLQSRYNLGSIEQEVGNMDRALKHIMIAAGSGCADSLDNIKQNHLRGHISKDDYAKALRSYQAHVDEVKSDQRDEAAAVKDEWKYY